MILSFGSEQPAGLLLTVLSITGVLAYALAAVWATRRPKIWRAVLALAWCLHLAALVADIAGIGAPAPPISGGVRPPNAPLGGAPWTAIARARAPRAMPSV